MSAGAGFGRSVRNGAIAGVVFVAVVAAAVLLVPGLSDRSPQPIERFILVVAGPGEDGATGARIIAEVDLGSSGGTTGASVTALDPGRKATIQGTSYDRLADAYAFGGGAGVAKAAYDDPLPHVSLDLQQFDQLVLASAVSSVYRDGGIEVDVPCEMEVFTGARLVSFAEGPVTLASGEDAIWLLEGASYVSAKDRDALRQRVAEQAVKIASRARGGLAGLVQSGQASSDVPAESLPAVALR